MQVEARPQEMKAGSEADRPHSEWEVEAGLAMDAENQVMEHQTVEVEMVHLIQKDRQEVTIHQVEVVDQAHQEEDHQEVDRLEWVETHQDL